MEPKSDVPQRRAYVFNLKRQSIPGAVFIGRGSRWGNPYSHLWGTTAKFRVRSREEALQKYDQYLDTRPDLLESLDELDGKPLACSCHPLPCHGHILIRRLEQRKAQNAAKLQGSL